MRDRIEGLEALIVPVDPVIAAEALLDAPDEDVMPAGAPFLVRAAFWLPPTWDAFDLLAIWYLGAAPNVAGALVLAGNTAALGDGVLLAGATEAGRTTIANGSLNVQHLHVTAIATGVEAEGDGQLLATEVYRDRAAGADTIGLTANASLAGVMVRPNYDD